MHIDELNRQRYYASVHYLLPADESETTRLNSQHRVVTRAFENKLSLVPMELQTGYRVLESGAGTGLWALEFSEQNKEEGIVLDMECIDISDKQFPATHPSNVHFSVHSVVNLPAEWSGTFSYAHQRLLVGAMNDLRWRKAVSELFRVLSPGGWVELLEHDEKDSDFGVGPCSKKLESLILAMYAERGIISDLGTYLPSILAEVGFVDVRREARQVTIGRSGETGYRSEDWRDLWKGTKVHVLSAGGYGLVTTEKEYDELLEGSTDEWNNSDKAVSTFYTILARKP
ncbi:hypothetical protein GYMLUDRAFT_46149 [Collybiopsis luxurians FD-317 M1]|uniref:Methyltransferase domain-containing protein n=1 Tax=Collybiopsis luxurians FD-317 M1 TaxID=944289 RepID=A0A0D0C568_9AGAR|nr:hypothetical protein GYMLUDRAFT_46149 [Collybiopsis luxurians FD-317 M1]